MTEERSYYWAKTATISFAPDGGTAIDVGILQDVEFRAVFETTDLEGAGTIKRSDIGIKKVRIKCKGVIQAIDFGLIADICSPSGSSWTDGTGIFTGIEDTSVASLFDVTATCDDTSGKTFTVVAKNVVYKDIPIMVGTWGEWLEWDLDGEGDDYTAVEATA